MPSRKPKANKRLSRKEVLYFSARTIWLNIQTFLDNGQLYTDDELKSYPGTEIDRIAAHIEKESDKFLKIAMRLSEEID